MLISYIHLQHTFHHHNKKRLSQRLINISISSTNLVPLLPYKHHLGPRCVWLNIQGAQSAKGSVPVCDETQNLNETESETFFRYQFFSIPNPILFSIPIFFRNRYRYFYRYQKISIPILFWYQNFLKPILILFPRPIFFRNQFFFETDTNTIKNMEKFQNRIWKKLWTG